MFPTPATLINSGAIPPLLGTLVLALAFAAYRRLVDHQEWRAILRDVPVLSSVSITCAVTLLRNEGPWSPTGNVFWAPTGLNRFIEGLGNDSEITLNILLFTPAAAIITWRYRRPLVEFTGTTIVVYDRWDSTGELPAKVFRMNESFSDGATLDAQQATIRFPANTLGIRRCVLATWTKQGFTTKKQSGPPCEAFMG
jgi:hypothetical protein